MVEPDEIGAGAPELTVVAPAYNEAGNVEELAARLARALVGVAWELIVVDDDSPDGTAAIVKALGERDGRIRCIRRIGRRGLAGACIEGMLASSARYVAVIDADLQHDETILPAMLAEMRGGRDLVVATRNAGGGSKDEGLSATRQAVSDLGRRLSAMILKAKISDPMSGFFMVRRDLVEAIAPRLATAGVKILADIAASAPGRLSVAEVPYMFRERAAGESKLDVKVALDYLGFLINKLSGGLVPVRFVFFALVGSTGVVVHLATLWGAMSAGVAFGAAQIVATYVAMTSNFLINNTVTFRDARLKGAGVALGLAIFYVVCSIGAVANVGVANWFHAGAAEWWLAGLSGALVGAVWNYAASSTFVWRRR